MKNNDIYNDVILSKAAEYNTAPDIHNEDFIFKFLINNPSFKCVGDAINYYFMDGRNSARKLSGLINDMCKNNNDHINLLEFASGFGCVTRHFDNELEGVDVTSCDIHEKAVDFIKSNLGMNAILSNSKPESFNTNVKYDVIFALSFFSHMPKLTWTRWLNALMSNTKENGYIIFTTQGQDSKKFFGNPTLDNEGFWFKSESEQKDLDTSEYGQTIVSPDYVLNVINNSSQMELIKLYESDWWEHQDLYIVKRV